MTVLPHHPKRRLLTATATVTLAILMSTVPAHATQQDSNTVPTASRTAAARTTTDGGTIDTSNRQQVLDAFTSRWIPAMATPVAWTGDVATCQPGSLSTAVIDASLSATNYLRDMAGVPMVAADPAKHAAAQQAALMMDANNTLDHYPPATWRCYTTAGATGASSSNLAIGSPGVRALAAYMADTGAHNSSVGHRKWILDPTLRTVGFGGTARTHAMHVVDHSAIPSSEAPPPVGIAWPTAGYFPEGLYPKATYYNPDGPLNAPGAGRWSYTTYDWDHDFQAATVAITQTAPVVRALPVTVEGGSFGHIVFTPTGPTLPSANNGADVTYQVTISGIRDYDDAPVADITYSTTLVASPPVPGDPNFPDDTDDDADEDTDGPGTPRTTGKAVIKGATKGTARPGTRLRAALTGLNRTPQRVTYQWLRNGRTIKAATRSTYRVTRADARSKIRVKIVVRKPRAVAGTYRSTTVSIRRR